MPSTPSGRSNARHITFGQVRTESKRKVVDQPSSQAGSVPSQENTPASGVLDKPIRLWEFPQGKYNHCPSRRRAQLRGNGSTADCTDVVSFMTCAVKKVVISA
jgi:hypothetical protein